MLVIPRQSVILFYGTEIATKLFAVITPLLRLALSYSTAASGAVLLHWCSHTLNLSSPSCQGLRLLFYMNKQIWQLS